MLHFFNFITRTWRLFSVEWSKFVRQRFPWLALGLVIIAAVLIVRNLDAVQVSVQLTGYSMLIMAVTLASSSFIPMLVIIFGSTLIATEITHGTTRLLLARPVRRFEFMTAKVMIGVTFAAILLCAFVIAAWAATPRQFPYETVVDPDEGEMLASQAQLIGYLALALLGTMFQLTAALSFGLMMSVLARGLINAIGAAIAFYIGTDVFKHFLRIGEFELAPYTFSSYLTDYLSVAQNMALGLPTYWFEPTVGSWREPSSWFSLDFWSSLTSPGIGTVLVPVCSILVFLGVAYSVFLYRDLHE